MATHREKHWYEDTDVPAAAEGVYKRMRQQWLKLKARSDQVRGRLAEVPLGCAHRCLVWCFAGSSLLANTVLHPIWSPAAQLSTASDSCSPWRPACPQPRPASSACLAAVLSPVLLCGCAYVLLSVVPWLQELGGLVAEGDKSPKEEFDSYLQAIADDMRSMDYEVQVSREPLNCPRVIRLHPACMRCLDGAWVCAEAGCRSRHCSS